MIKAIIFDMDGVLALTSNFQSGAESEVLSKIGIEISAKSIIRKYSGWKDIDVFADILKENEVKGDVNKLREEKWNLIYKKLNNTNIASTPGVIEFIKKLRDAGYLLSVASGTALKFVKIILKRTKMLNYFVFFTTSEEITVGKPNPEIFLIAAQKLGIDPSECLVFEDATNGVRAAYDAGMKCIAITTTHERNQLQEADRVIDSFDEISIDDIQRL